MSGDELCACALQFHRHRHGSKLHWHFARCQSVRISCKRTSTAIEEFFYVGTILGLDDVYQIKERPLEVGWGLGPNA